MLLDPENLLEFLEPRLLLGSLCLTRSSLLKGLGNERILPLLCTSADSHITARISSTFASIVSSAISWNTRTVLRCPI